MDYDKFKEEYISFEEWSNEIQAAQPVDLYTPTDSLSFNVDDRVNHPSHYTAGKQEAIEVIEDTVEHAPSHVAAVLHSQVLKYLLRLWLKDNPLEDAKKARWYLDRLISKLEA